MFVNSSAFKQLKKGKIENKEIYDNLLSSGISVALPIYLSLNNPEHASLLVPIVILIGITTMWF